VDLNEEVIEVYRQPRGAGYDSKMILKLGDKASPQPFPDVLVDVDDLLRR
jgi:hypothetical protein